MRPSFLFWQWWTSPNIQNVVKYIVIVPSYSDRDCTQACELQTGVNVLVHPYTVHSTCSLQRPFWNFRTVTTSMLHTPCHPKVPLCIVNLRWFCHGGLPVSSSLVVVPYTLMSEVIYLKAHKRMIDAIILWIIILFRHSDKIPRIMIWRNGCNLVKGHNIL